MKLHERDEWAKLRSEGVLVFILKFGLLRWAFPLALLISFITEILQRGLALSSHSFADTFGFYLMFFIPAGIFFGAYLWWSNNRKYPVSNHIQEES